MVDLNLTKRQQEIFDFIKRYSSRHGYRPPCATSARPSASPRPRPFTRTSPTWRRSACCGATRRSRARSRCSTRPSRASRASCAPAACRSWASRRGPAGCSPRRTSRSTSRYPPRRRGRRRVPAARARRLDEGCRHPRRRPRRGAPAEHGKDGQIVVALVGEEATIKRFFKEADHVRLQPENPAMEPIRSRRYVSLAGSSASCGRSRDDASRRTDRASRCGRVVRRSHPGAPDRRRVARPRSPRERGVPALRRGDVTVVRRAWHVHRVRHRAFVVLRAAAALTALAAVAVAAGCGGNSLDTRRVEARLRVGITHRGSTWGPCSARARSTRSRARRSRARRATAPARARRSPCASWTTRERAVHDRRPAGQSVPDLGRRVPCTCRSSSRGGVLLRESPDITGHGGQ